MRERFLIAVSIAGIIGGIAAIVYVQLGQQPTPTETFTEPTAEQEAAPEPVPVAQGGITVRYYGGPEDVKTALEGGIEYALVRNPENTGGLTVATTEQGSTYYFATTVDGNKITYEAGDDDAFHGFNERGLVSGEVLTSLFSSTGYFIAYPDSTSARLANFTDIPDTGIANRYLQSQVAKITNKNTGRAVIATINHRGALQNTLFVSEAVGRELQLDNGATGNISIELIPATEATVGPVR